MRLPSGSPRNSKLTGRIKHGFFSSLANRWLADDGFPYWAIRFPHGLTITKRGTPVETGGGPSNAARSDAYAKQAGRPIILGRSLGQSHPAGKGWIPCGGLSPPKDLFSVHTAFGARLLPPALFAWRLLHGAIFPPATGYEARITGAPKINPRCLEGEKRNNRFSTRSALPQNQRILRRPP